MATPLLTTKLFIPPPQPNLIPRPRLVAQLNSVLQRKLILVSAPAGFGKTTLVSTWIAAAKADQRIDALAWLSLDEDDNDPLRFLSYLIMAMQRVIPDLGQELLGVLGAPQPPPIDTLLATLLNELANALVSSSDESGHMVVVFDDYHVLDNEIIDNAFLFLLDHLPPQLHFVIATREDPPLPLARLRARAQLAEIRAADLRFTPAEAAEFLNQGMGLTLTTDEIAALDARTEGWIAGLQLAAVSMQSHQNSGQTDVAAFIESFTGSHRFVMDYLLEEVLHQQSAQMQKFLLYTSVLDRFCGALCDAILNDDTLRGQAKTGQTPSGQATLETLERANLFLIPLDNERRWYRYHHLFADLLRQRLQQQLANADDDQRTVAELHRRASQWYEANDLELEAFHHATIANDVARAERLIEGRGMPLHFRGIIRPVLKWLDMLPPATLDAHPSLWLAYASTLLATGQIVRTQEVLNAAERLLAGKENAGPLDDQQRDLMGRIAAIRATVAAGLQQLPRIITESQRALEYLHPDNLAFRTSTSWKLGYAYHLDGEFAAAKAAYQEAIVKSQASGNKIFTIMSHIGLADVYQVEAQLVAAAEHFQSAADLYGEQPLPSASEAYSGLAQIYYEWNQLAFALQYAERGLVLGEQWENSDTPIRSEWILAQTRLGLGEVARATAHLRQLITRMEEFHFTRHLDGVLTTYLRALLAQGMLDDQASRLVAAHALPLSQARLLLMQGETARTITTLDAIRQQMAADGQQHEMMQAMTLQTVALHQHGQATQALQLLGEILLLAEPGGYIRLFVDEGPVMAELLTQLSANNVFGVTAAYLNTVLAAFPTSALSPDATPDQPSDQDHGQQSLAEPLSDRELEVLHLIASGQKNQEIADQLFVSLNTVRYHTKNIYGKLGVNKRTQAVAKAQELDLL